MDDELTHPGLAAHPHPSGEPGRCAVLLHYRSGIETLRLSPGKKVTVGRGKQADVVVDSPVLSRLHVSFEAVTEGVRLVDLGSHNGTRVSGEPVTDTVLQ